MNVLVMGSGIIGTTTAYYLALQGHRVRVIDRQPAGSMETSFANAGQISPGYASPWAAPGIPVKAVKWMLSRHSPLVINAKPDWDKIKFISRMLMQCNGKNYSINKSRMLRIAEYSRLSLQEFQQETGISYDDRKMGTLQLFRTAQQVKDANKDMALLDKFQIPYESLQVNACVAAEPALERVKHKIAGGLRLPLDQTGDCFKLSSQLVSRCQEMGVEFLFKTDIKVLKTEGQRIHSVVTSMGEFSADQYVIALGSYSTSLLKSVNISCPVYPVKGYSITLPIINEAAAPVSTVMDETYKVAITRLGERVRVAGTAELNGFNLDLNEKRRATIRHVVSDLFPDAADLTQDGFWTGLRPMTPDGTPVIGATDIANLYTNTGHGTLGWTMSFGSARLLADIMSGKQTDIACEDLSIKRYSSAAGKSTQRGKLSTAIGV